jgi:hypothetical protein
MPRFQYDSEEDGRSYPSVVTATDKDGIDTVEGFTVSHGDIIEAIQNPDPSRFVDLVAKKSTKVATPK